MRRSSALAAVLFAAAGVDVATSVEASSGMNPIRKVVRMLQMMETKVIEEGRKKKEMFDKYVCYCHKSDAELQKSIDSAKERIPQLVSSLEETKQAHKQLKNDVEKHKKDRKAAEEALSSAKALRTKESQAFDKDSANLKANIDALRKAIGSVEKGSGGFLQTNSATVLRKLSLSLDMTGADRDVLASFLSQGSSSSDYAPQSGEVLGILKQMNDEMDKELVDMTQAEEAAVGNHESLLIAKKKEVAAATKAIEAKTGRAGELAVELTTLEDDLGDAQSGLQMNTGLLAEVEQSCQAKKGEWAQFEKAFTEEKVALAETIKLLNDDAALDLFSKTLPKPGAAAAASFLEVADSSKASASVATSILRKAKGKDLRLNFLALALHGKKKGFDKVLEKIDGLVASLKKEQDSDDKKKTFCESEIDKTEDELKKGERDVKDTGTFLANAQDALDATTTEIETLMAGIRSLDQDVKDATETRKEENAQSVEELAANNAAKSLLELAKNRLRKLYNPKMFKAAPKQELDSEGDRIAENFGASEGPATGDSSAPSFVQVSKHEQQAAEDEGEEAEEEEETDAEVDGEEDAQGLDPAPEADLSHKKQHEGSGGVMAMLDMLKQDLVRQITETEVNEKNSQASYEALMKRSADKRAEDSKAIGDKESAKAEIEAELGAHREDLVAQKKTVQISEQEVSQLHGDCDWLIKNYPARAEARTDEADSLQKAKAVLSGASYN